jgi:hypothetical protein
LIFVKKAYRARYALLSQASKGLLKRKIERGKKLYKNNHGFAFGFLVRLYLIAYIDAIDVCYFIFLKNSLFIFSYTNLFKNAPESIRVTSGGDAGQMERSRNGGNGTVSNYRYK